MKKFLFLLLFTFVCANLDAQHIEFSGISLGQPFSTIDQAFRQKGYSKDISDSELLTYKGRFWKFEDALIWAWIEDGWTVSRVTVSTKAQVSDYNSLVNNYRQKYGKSSFNRDGTRYKHSWGVKGGRIEAMCHKELKSNNVHIMIEYIDRTSRSYNPKKHNPNDDL